MRAAAATVTQARSGSIRAAVSDLPIVLACDANYAMQLATALRSLVESNSRAWPLDLHVFWEGSDETCRRVEASLPPGAATIRWIPVDLSPFSGYSIPPGLSPMAFARILIPRAFPTHVERVLYLDADMLILDDLEALVELDLEGALVGAVADLPLQRARECGDHDHPVDGGTQMAGLQAYCREVLPRVPPVRDYFNSGVLLIDLPRWRAEQISEQALAYLASNPSSPFGDQDALNMACDGHWVPLDSRWNHQDHLLVAIDELAPSERPAIAHFITTNKPWKASTLSRNAALWDRFRSRTGFTRTWAERVADGLMTCLHPGKRALLRVHPVQVLWRSLKRRRLMNDRTTARETDVEIQL